MGLWLIFQSQGKSLILLFLFIIAGINFLISVLFIGFLSMDCIQKIFLNVREDGSFFLLFFIGCPFALGVCLMLSLPLSSLRSAVPKSPFSYLSLLRSYTFFIVFFSRSFQSYSLPFFLPPLFLLFFSFSLGTIVGILSFVPL